MRLVVAPLPPPPSTKTTSSLLPSMSPQPPKPGQCDGRSILPSVPRRCQCEWDAPPGASSLAQPHDATKDETVVASPTEQHPLKPSPPLPRVGGVPMRVLFGRGVTLSFFSRLSNVEMESIPINFYFIMMAVMERALPEYW
jgi:hypothetical protein